jgi:arylsulfatase A
MFRAAVAIVVALIVASKASPVPAPRPPNIVVILIDDMGWTDLGCQGSDFYRTPNIDKLAKQGLRFTNGYAACPVCSPTRAALMTGKNPARLHLTDWLPGRKDMPSQKLARPVILQHLPLEETTIAEALKSAGYVSASIGKWHLGGEGFLPTDQGFDKNVGGTSTGSPPMGYFKFKTPTLSAADDKEYLTDRLTDEALKFIDASKDKPFFLYLPHYTVHIPLQAKAALVEKYQALPPGKNHQNAIYAAMIESLDDGVGRVMKKLAELKLDDNTFVVFTSDNGGLSVKEGKNTPSTSNAPLREGKGYLYEGGIRVPFIVRWPGHIRPGVNVMPIVTTDLFPTLCAVAGVKLDPKTPCDGRNMLPLMLGFSVAPREPIYWHYPHYSNQGGKPGAAVRDGSFKLIEFYEDMHVELYDLGKDIDEKEDLAQKELERAKRLTKLLHDWRQEVDAQMPTPNPMYKGTK